MEKEWWILGIVVLLLMIGLLVLLLRGKGRDEDVGNGR